MRQKAFTVIETIIIIFLLIVLASILIPLKLVNISQAEKVSKWNNTYEEIIYSFRLVAAKTSESLNLKECKSPEDTEKTFEMLKPYLNIDKSKSNPEYFKNYKYKFLNGEKINKHSDFYVKDFVILESGVIIGFKTLGNCESPKNNKPKAIMLFDVNGIEKPNKIGKDIFGIYLYEDKIKPFGEGSSIAALKANCSPIGSGVFCSKYYLVGSEL